MRQPLSPIGNNNLRDSKKRLSANRYGERGQHGRVCRAHPHPDRYGKPGMVNNQLIEYLERSGTDNLDVDTTRY